MKINIPRIIISGVRGKSGKTTITLGIIKGLIDKGFRVQPFKVGPDYIDPSYHTSIAGRYSRNLDSIMFTDEVILKSFGESLSGANIAVIEGVLGLYDSPDGINDVGSTAYLSKLLRAPVILIINAERINRGIQAILYGFINFDKEVAIKGVIINNVKSRRQADKILEGIRGKFSDIKILGMIPKNDDIERIMSYRHLGLIHADERIKEGDTLNKMADYIKEYIDIDSVIEIANEAREIDIPVYTEDYEKIDLKVGIIKDNIFTFYYPENLIFISKYANKVYYINSLNDPMLPDIDLLIIGGGFPEIYASNLEKNRSLMKDIRMKYDKEKIFIYAECGGLMYLTNSIIGFDGDNYSMLGLIDGYIKMTRKPVGHGYVYLKALKDNPLIKRNGIIIGHEFHYSNLFLNEKVEYAFKILRGYGVNGKYDGILKKNILALYTHIHVNHNTSIIYNLLKNSYSKKL